MPYIGDGPYWYLRDRARGFNGAHTHSEGVGFSLAAFMAAQSDGFWFDFSQTDRLFQEQCGPTPSDDPNEVIGLALSQRLWNGQTRAAYLAAQPNLATVTTQAAVAIGGPAFTNYTISAAMTIGRTYEISITVTGYSGTGSVGIAGGVGAYDPDLVNEGISGNGTITVYGRAQLATQIQLFSQSSNTCTFANISIKEVCRQQAFQTSTSLKPKFQTTGAEFDGSDDNLLTGYLPSATANFIVAKVTVPASLAATQVIVGSSGASTDRCFLAINTSGLVCGGVGTQSTTTILGTTDLRGREVVIGLSFDGSTVRLFADGAQQYSAAQAGTPSASIPFRVGATNNNGTAGSFFAGSIKNVEVGREMIDASRFSQIANAS